MGGHIQAERPTRQLGIPGPFVHKTHATVLRFAAMEISQLIRETRAHRGHTQAAAAESVGVSAPTISRWESAQDVPQFKVVPALAEYLGLTEAQVLTSIHEQISADSREAALREEISLLREEVAQLRDEFRARP